MSSFTVNMKALAKTALDGLAESVGYAKPGDAVAKAKVEDFIAKLQPLVEELVDEIPGVPKPVAHIIVQVVAQVIRATIATATNKAK